MKKKHSTHRYQRARLGSVYVWRCILGGCLHYVHNDFIVGLESICRCGRKFNITKDKQRRKTPKCDTCQARSGLEQKLGGSQDSVTEQTMEKVREINIDDLLEGLK